MIEATRKHRPNLSEIAYDEIREMILSGELAQGERIVLERMSEQLNLSITPIREALNKLAQDDLIKVTPRSSYEVISLGPDDINDILDLREMLETFALRTAGENLAQFPVGTFRESQQKINRGIYLTPVTPISCGPRFFLPRACLTKSLNATGSICVAC